MKAPREDLSNEYFIYRTRKYHRINLFRPHLFSIIIPTSVVIYAVLALKL